MEPEPRLPKESESGSPFLKAAVSHLPCHHLDTYKMQISRPTAGQLKQTFQGGSISDILTLNNYSL